MKKAVVILCLFVAVCSVTAQVHIPLSKTVVGFWQLSSGQVHGDSNATGMFSVFNPDGTFYMFTIGGKELPKATMLQSGIYTSTSDSTFDQQILKSFGSYGAGEGQKFKIKYELVTEDVLIWNWSANGSSWNKEVWSRVK